MGITLNPKALARLASAAIAVLFLAHLAVQIIRFATGDHSLFGLVTMLSLGSDRNFPTFYSSFAILLCAVLQGVVASVPRAGRRGRDPYWCGLAAIFLFLSVDEMLEIHERLNDVMRAALNTSGVFFYGWVIPYGIATLIFVAVYARFIWRLPGRTRSLFIVAGAIYVGGALGMEMVGGRYSQAHGNNNIPYVAFQTVEETMEMTGIAIFLYAIADYLVKHRGGLRVHLE